MEEKKSSALAAIIAASVLRLAVAGWLGGAALFTFILTPTLFRTLNRDQAGTIVGYLFPGYFRWGLVCGVLALAVLALTKFTRKRRIALVLIGMLAITTIQAFIIEPRAVALKRQIPSF